MTITFVMRVFQYVMNKYNDYKACEINRSILSKTKETLQFITFNNYKIINRIYTFAVLGLGHIKDITCEVSSKLKSNLEEMIF